MALKFLKKKTTKLKSFLREYSISLYLSPCPFIINMFGIAFETDEYYVFAQEYALAGDLFDIIPPQVLHLINCSDYFLSSLLASCMELYFLLSHDPCKKYPCQFSAGQSIFKEGIMFLH